MPLVLLACAPGAPLARALRSWQLAWATGSGHLVRAPCQSGTPVRPKARWIILLACTLPRERVCNQSPTCMGWTVLREQWPCHRGLPAPLGWQQRAEATIYCLSCPARRQGARGVCLLPATSSTRMISRGDCAGARNHVRRRAGAGRAAGAQRADCGRGLHQRRVLLHLQGPGRGRAPHVPQAAAPDRVSLNVSGFV